MNLFGKLFLAVLVFSVIVGLLVQGSSNEVQARFLSKPQQQAEPGRVWKTRPTERLLTIGGKETDIFDYAWEVRVDGKDNVYIWDVNALTVTKFTSEGQPSGVLGGSRGPSTFRSITDLLVQPDGHAWVTDAKSNNVTIFSPTGLVQKTIFFPRSVYRIPWATGNDMVVMFGSTDSHLFGRTQISGNTFVVHSQYGKLVRDQSRVRLALDGSVAANKDGDVVFSPWYFGALARFSKDGSLKFLVDTIDPSSPPSVVTETNGVTHVARDTRESSKGVSWAGDEIFVLAVVRDGFKNLGVIDAYDAETGRYKYSIRSPEPCINVLVTDHHLYTVRKKSISKWTRSF